jgi:hypothetical protein
LEFIIIFFLKKDRPTVTQVKRVTRYKTVLRDTINAAIATNSSNIPHRAGRELAE